MSHSIREAEISIENLGKALTIDQMLRVKSKSVNFCAQFLIFSHHYKRF